MILTEQEIKKVASETIADITKLQERDRRLKMNIFGDNYVDFLVKKSNLETKEQYDLRKRHSLSNRGFWSSILNKIDRVFDAKGGSVSFYSKNASPEKVKETLSTHIDRSGNEITLMQFVSDTWENLLITSPDSFTLIDGVLADGVASEFKYTPIDIQQIKNFKRKGKSGYEFVCYEQGTHVSKQKNTFGISTTTSHTVFYVIDDFANYTVIRKNEEYIIADFETPLLIDGVEYLSYQHGFLSCPAVANSNFVFDDNKNRKSPAWDALEESERLMEENSTLTGFKFLHGYPFFWMFNLAKCQDCDGTGKDSRGQTCKKCGGSGSLKKDVSNVVEIEPQEEDEPIIPVPNVAGYVSPPVDAWKQMHEDISGYKDNISKIFWGTIIDPVKNNQTATGQILDEQPVVAKLNTLTKAAELFINSFANLIGGFIYSEAFTEANITLGNTYLIQSPNALLDQYLKIKELNNDELKTQVLLDYWQHKYSKQPVEFIRKEKELSIEPYPHNSVSEVLAMEVSAKIKNRKVYFDEWNSLVSNPEYVTKTTQKLRVELDNYAVQNAENQNPES